MTVLIVEKDLALSHSLREALESRGFAAEESSDGKGAPELIRQLRPTCVVLAVDLDAGQNGYIICKKLKSDDELKGIPVVIVGDPKGFAQHQKLKTHAEDYVGKPFSLPALVERIGGLIGFPEPAAPAAEEDQFDPGSLLDDDELAPAVEEIAIDPAPAEEPVSSSDSGFELVDSMLDDAPPAAAAEPAPPAADEPQGGFPDVPLDEDELESPGDRTVVGFMPPPPTRRHEAPAFTPSGGSAGLDGDSRELRAKVKELTGSLDEAREQAGEHERRARELEAELDARTAELEAARAAGGKSDNKEVFTLKDSLNKKDKEILRLKSELNEREQELLELRDKENNLEQQASESSGEMARKDAQLKTLQAKTDQLTADRKRLDQQLAQAKEEARGAQAMVTTLQADVEALQGQIADLTAQLGPLQESMADADGARARAESELAEARGESEALKAQLDERSREAEELRHQFEQAQLELDSTRGQVTTQATTFADEISGLRQRLADAEAETARHGERASRHEARLKANADQLERLRESLQQALASLEATGDGEEVDVDEVAEA